MLNNVPIVTINQFRTIVKQTFKEGNKRPIMGIGAGGIGKSEVLASTAREMGIGFIDVRLLLHKETDIKGIQYPSADHTTTVCLQSDLLPREERDGKTGILLFDEITSAKTSLRTVAYQLLQERKLGAYELPEGWLVVCIGNGEGDGGDYQGLEPNFCNRCTMFRIMSSVEDWREWAVKSGINSLVLAFIGWKPGRLHSFVNTDEIDENDSDSIDEEEQLLFASPRSWSAVSDILNKISYKPDDTLTNLRILGNLGVQIGEEFIAFCKYKGQLYNIMDILDGKASLLKRSSDTESTFITIQELISEVYKHINSDLINNNNKISTKSLTECANAVKWILSSARAETMMMGLKDLLNKNRNFMPLVLKSEAFLTMCPELRDFLTNNRNVFIA